jgi:hypothetical protein
VMMAAVVIVLKSRTWRRARISALRLKPCDTQHRENRNKKIFKFHR